MNAAVDEKGIVIGCRECGARNRVPYANLGRTVRCGNCKAGLPLAGHVLDAPSAAIFHSVTSQSALPVLVDFWAPWCGPCKMMAPELETAARSLAGQALVVKANTEDLQEVAARFRITGIPTLAVLYRGQEISRASGARPSSEIVAFTQNAIRAVRPQ